MVWEDIVGDSRPWVELSEAKTLKPARMVTLGYLISETPSALTIAGTLDVHGSSVGDVNVIPKGTVRGLYDLLDSELVRS